MLAHLRTDAYPVYQTPRYPPERSTPLQRSYERNVALIADAKQRSEGLARPFVTPPANVER